MSHAKQVMRNSAKLFGSRIGVSLFSVVFMMIIARILTKQEMAIIAVFVILTAIVNTIKGLGFAGTTIKKVPELISKKKDKEASRLIRSTLLYPTILGFIISVLIFIFAKDISFLILKDTSLDHFIRIIVIAVFLASIYDLSSLVLKSLQRFGICSVVDFSINLLQRVLAISLFFIYGIKGYIAGFIIAFSVGVILIIYFTRDYVFTRSGLYPFKKLFNHSLPYYVEGFGNYLFKNSDRLIMALFFMPEMLATYHIARTFIEYLVVLAHSMLEPILPKISEFKKEGIKTIQKIFKKTSRFYSMILIPACFLTASLSFFLLHLYGGYKYTDGYLILTLLAFAILIYAYFMLYGINVYILKKPIERLKYSLVAGTSNLLLSLVLIQFIGLLGIPIALILAYLIGLAYTRNQLKTFKLKIDSNIVVKLFVMSIIASVVLVVLQLIYYNLFIVPVYVVGISVIYFYFFTKVLHKKDVLLIKEFLPNKLKKLAGIFYICNKNLK